MLVLISLNVEHMGEQRACYALVIDLNINRYRDAKLETKHVSYLLM